MMTKYGVKKKFLYLGNNLAIDFANTIYGAQTGQNELVSPPDLADFLHTAGISAPSIDKQTFAASKKLRDAIRQILVSLDKKKPLAPTNFRIINELLRRTARYYQLDISKSNPMPLRLKYVHDDPITVLDPIILAAAELAVRNASAPVHKCANPACVLYFQDISRTHRRQWCSMAVCGNRTKVAAYAKRKAGKK